MRALFVEPRRQREAVKPIDLLKLGGLRRTPFVEQSEAAECGLACLAMVAGHHGLKTDMPALRRSAIGR